MLFLDSETNSLIKGSSFIMVLEDQGKDGVIIIILITRLVSMLIKHVDSEVGIRISVRGF